MPELNIRLLDQAIIGLGFLVLVIIGIRCSRRSQTDEGYFLAGRSMPGWVVGFSLMATIVSSLTFLGLPAFAFGDSNWRNVLSHFTYIPAMLVAVYLFIPFYRSTRVRSAYEYLELRFGLWARLYAAAAFVLFHFFRTGLVLYAVSLAIQSILGTDQTNVQRYAAARSDKDASRGAVIGCCLAIPTWTYFVSLLIGSRHGRDLSGLTVWRPRSRS